MTSEVNLRGKCTTESLSLESSGEDGLWIYASDREGSACVDLDEKAGRKLYEYLKGVYDE